MSLPNPTAPPAPPTFPAASPPKPSAGLRPVSGRTWVDIGILLALALLGVIGFEPSFGGFGFLLAGLGGLALGAITGIGASILRLGALTTTAAAIVGYFLFGTALAVPSQAIFGVFPSLQSLASVAVGTVFGWADIVTLSTPIGAPQYIAVVPYFAAWIVALVSTTLATRWLSTRPRTAWRFAIALIGPVALYLGSILIGTDEPYLAGIRGTAFAVLALVWLGWRRPAGNDGIAVAGANRLRRRKLAGTAIIVIGAVLLGGAGAFWVAPPKDERFVLRDEIEPPFDPLQYPSPLAGFRHYTKYVTDELLFSVSGLQQGDVIRLATLDSFTGKLWNVTGSETSAGGSGSFALVGRTLPQPSFITPETRKDVTFTIETYDDVWVPGVGYPTDLVFTDGDAATSADNLRYNAATGTAVLTSGLHEGDVYTIDALVQKIIAPEDLTDVGIAAVELPPIEGAPDIVTSKAQDLAGSTTTPIEQLQAIETALRSTGFLSHGRASDSVSSRAGHGADRINELFTRNQMIGDQEQYASAFALMARSFGYPARVVMGFAPEITEGQTSVDVTGDDVTAWVEVAFEGVGWVAFNPTPDETDIPQDQVPKPQSEPQPQVRQPPRAEKDDEDLLSPVELEETDEDDNGLGFVLPGWAIALGLSILIPAAIILIPMLVIGILKSRRAARRRRGAEHDKVAGAWAELTDQYSELGYKVPAKTTRVNVAEALEAQIETAEPGSLRTLASVTDRAVFSGADVDPQESDRVWTEASAAVALAKSALGRGKRFIARYRIRVKRRAGDAPGTPEAEKAPKAAKAPKAPKEPKAPKAPKEPKAPKTAKSPDTPPSTDTH